MDDEIEGRAIAHRLLLSRVILRIDAEELLAEAVREVETMADTLPGPRAKVMAAALAELRELQERLRRATGRR